MSMVLMHRRVHLEFTNENTLVLTTFCKQKTFNVKNEMLIDLIDLKEIKAYSNYFCKIVQHEDDHTGPWGYVYYKIMKNGVENYVQESYVNWKQKRIETIEPLVIVD